MKRSASATWQSAADEFRPLYDRTDGKDGYVSLEVQSPPGARPNGTMLEARRLWGALNRPNVFIKVPATAEGLPAIPATHQRGNQRKRHVALWVAALSASSGSLPRRHRSALAQGKPVQHVTSVASFFVSVLMRWWIRCWTNLSRKAARRQTREKGARASRHRPARNSLPNLRELFGSDTVQEAGGSGRSCSATALGQHQHQEPGLQ